MFEVKILEKTDKRGMPYVCLELTFPCGYKKIVFLDKAEQHLAAML